ncbi:hypothetical protein GCM10010260_54080 [Streptomyces filipinensis]|uniref:Uncharacterized protein n=1 Tax=Streptomyces filipinensis TaxID=66887 RepID=A0A918MCQ2_9ACTN|nr:hypothetical protein GCM10010260_54080 [Streptomyces filipinensis]
MRIRRSGVRASGHRTVLAEASQAVQSRRHGGVRHYDLVALPDVSIQPDVPGFMDCAVAGGATKPPRRRGTKVRR